jgi:hypothetical protein
MLFEKSPSTGILHVFFYIPIKFYVFSFKDEKKMIENNALKKGRKRKNLKRSNDKNAFRKGGISKGNKST